MWACAAVLQVGRTDFEPGVFVIPESSYSLSRRTNATIWQLLDVTSGHWFWTYPDLPFGFRISWFAVLLIRTLGPRHPATFRAATLRQEPCSIELANQSMGMCFAHLDLLAFALHGNTAHQHRCRLLKWNSGLSKFLALIFMDFDVFHKGKLQADHFWGNPLGADLPLTACRLQQNLVVTQLGGPSPLLYSAGKLDSERRHFF